MADLSGLSDADLIRLIQQAHAQAPEQPTKTFDTAADSAARGLPPNPRAQPVAHTGFAAQVGRTLSGEGPAAIQGKIPTPQEAITGVGREIGNVGIGAATGVPGTPGDIESLGRAVLSKVAPVSRDTVLPTSSTIANSLFGEPRDNYEAGARVVGNMLSPYLLEKTVQGVGKLAGFAGRHAFGLTTGAGPDAIGEAFKAGQQGGDAGEAFLGNLRGDVAPEDVVQQAKGALNNMRAERQAAYRAGIGSTIKGDPAVLDFQPIDEAVNRVANVQNFKGQSLSSGAEKAANAVKDAIDQWRALPPDQFHTPEGLDALKQKIGNLAFEENLAKPGSPAAKIIGDAYNAVKDQIVDQAPGYADVMKDYSKASDELRQVETTLSLGKKATTDTSLRKLQSLMRNNANTNYGARVAAGERLTQAGADTLMPSLAGQQLSAWLPRGLGKAVAGGEVGYAAFHPEMWPALAGTLAASSPRLVGEGAYLAGRMTPDLNNMAQVLAATSGAGKVAALPNDPLIRALMASQTMALPAQQAAYQSP